MHVLYLDCSYGIGGDMLLAALHGLGVSFSDFEVILRAAGLAVQIEVTPVRRQGVAGWSAAVRWDDGQPLRHLAELTDIVERLELTDTVRKKSLAALCTLAEAEAAVHGIPLEDVHFHEVGAIDTLADVVGSFWALEQLGITEVVCSPLPWFTGTVCCAHGTMPLPAPATLRLLEGKPVYPASFSQEMITPTGALLIDALTARFAEGPEGRLLRSGLGYGTRDSGGGLRVLLMDIAERTDAMAAAVAGERIVSPVSGATEQGVAVEMVIQLESNIDHLTGEELGRSFEVLMEAGALDVLYLPGVMKKNRPGGVLRVLCTQEMLAPVQQAFFLHTHTLGIRRTLVERVVLKRDSGVMETSMGLLDVKRFTLGGKELSRPEYEALVAFSRKTGRSLPELRAMLSADCHEDARTDGQPETS